MVSHCSETKLLWTSAKNVFWADQQVSQVGCTALVAASLAVCVTNILQCLENSAWRYRLKELEGLVAAQPTLNLRSNTFIEGNVFRGKCFPFVERAVTETVPLQHSSNVTVIKPAAATVLVMAVSSWSKYLLQVDII